MRNKINYTHIRKKNGNKNECLRLSKMETAIKDEEINIKPKNIITSTDHQTHISSKSRK